VSRKSSMPILGPTTIPLFLLHRTGPRFENGRRGANDAPSQNYQPTKSDCDFGRGFFKESGFDLTSTIWAADGGDIYGSSEISWRATIPVAMANRPR
jgi:hypothetical protein